MEALNQGERIELVQIESWLTWKDMFNPFNPSPTEDCVSDNMTGDLESKEIADGIPFHLGVHIWPQTTGLELDFINSIFIFIFFW